MDVEVVSVDVPRAFAKGRHGLMLTVEAANGKAAATEATWLLFLAAAECRVTIAEDVDIRVEPPPTQPSLPLQGKKREDGQLKPRYWR